MSFSPFLYPFHGTTVFQKLFCSRYAFAARGWKIEPWDDAAQTLSSACESHSKRQCHLWKLCADFDWFPISQDGQRQRRTFDWSSRCQLQALLFMLSWWKADLQPQADQGGRDGREVQRLVLEAFQALHLFGAVLKCSLDWGSPCQDLWRYDTIYSIYT